MHQLCDLRNSNALDYWSLLYVRKAELQEDKEALYEELMHICTPFTHEGVEVRDIKQKERNLI